jgi:hypothetical protein
MHFAHDKLFKGLRLKRKFLGQCLSSPNTIGWVMRKQQFTSHILEAGEQGAIRFGFW